VVRDRNIVIYSKDGHAMWISRRVKESVKTWPKSVKGGVVFRDEQGEPTGMGSEFKL
jgi:predicted amidohydrolase YtcJ